MEWHQTKTTVDDDLVAQSRDLLIEVLSGPMDGLAFCFAKPLVTIGRADTNDLCLALDPLVSRSHARLSQESEGFWLEDANSLNGTFVGDMPLASKTQVQPGEFIRVGMTDLRITYDGPVVMEGKGLEKACSFSPGAERILEMALQEASYQKHYFIGTEHLFISLCKCQDELITQVLAQDRVNPSIRRVVRQILIPGSRPPQASKIIFTPRVHNVFKLSQEYAQTHGATHVGPIHILAGLLRAGDGLVVRLLRRLQHNPERLAQAAEEVITATPPQFLREDTPLLNTMGRDLTFLAGKGKLDPVIGREAEIALMTQSLLRKQKNNLILVGDAGVGKTTLVEGLAQLVAKGEAPPALSGKRIIEISAAGLVSGTRYRGDLEERVQKMLAEAQDKGIILFIDEFHTLMGRIESEGGLDIANMLKPALASDRLRLIGATTWKEYRSRIEPDPAFERRFQVIDVKEMTPQDAISLLNKLKEVYEEHHQVTLPPEVLKFAVDLAVRFLPHRRLPDKALDLVDQACANFRMQVMAKQLGEAGSECPSHVTREDVALALSGWVGIPVDRLLLEGKYPLLPLEKLLQERILGQDEAVEAVSSAVCLAQSGLTPPDRPRIALMFVGPTGVGKTEMAKAMAEILTPGQPALVRLDMSEFMELHAVAKLVGAPPGYVGYGEEGQLTGPVRRQPGSVVLFDEFDKAHPDVLNILLQVLDAGQLTDSKGRLVNFREAYIIFTANVTFSGKGPRIGFVEGEGRDVASEVIALLRNRFRPEFLNRLDKIIIFPTLTREVCHRLAELAVDQIIQHLSGQATELKIDGEIFDLVLDEADFQRYGAREIKRVVNRLLAEPLSRWLGQQEIKPTGVHASRQGHKIEFAATALKETGPASEQLPAKAG
ncbi:MAG: AAA family ATPase [Deltaproteobacteria bacterium]|nr:AAA family ATPase [Deltaproteobacteria bacterium]